MDMDTFIQQINGRFTMPTDYKEALMVIAQLVQQVDEQQEQINRMIKSRTAEQPTDLATFCKMLLNNDGISIGEKRLFAWLRNNGYLLTNSRERNKPLQKYLERGYFVIDSEIQTFKDGKRMTRSKTMLTQKGQVYFREKLIEYFGGGR